MMFYIPAKAQYEFSCNLHDWSSGGPKSGGWTRYGEPIPVPDVVLVSCRLGHISVSDGLAKNRAEVERWHLSFLAGERKMYFEEYLYPRYDIQQSTARAGSFIDLLSDIQRHGLKKPIWVADVEKLDIGMRYFRFDGCHRLCCAKHLKMNDVPAVIFKTA